MLIKLAVWYLRKRKRSVIIGYLIREGSMQPISDFACVYDNQFHGVKYFNQNGRLIEIPENKFNFKEFKK